MAMSLKVLVPPHPLLKHWLSILRDKNTPSVLYSTGYEQIGKWLTYEALRDWLPYNKQTLETDFGETDGYYIDSNHPLKIIAEIPEGLTLWYGAKEVIPNSTILLGQLPKNITQNEGVILYLSQIMKNHNPINWLESLNRLGVESKRILIISCICSNEGLNELAKKFPNQIIYTSCIDKESGKENILNPGIGNPMLRLSTMSQEKN
tara:strand:+ start:4048 stop:4665 length:618 start_codon:yes stop_codon:yes gene_type:complete